MDKIENFNLYVSDLSIVTKTTLLKHHENASSLDHSGPNRQKLLIVKATWPSEDVTKLIKSRIILDHERLNVKAYNPCR